MLQSPHYYSGSLVDGDADADSNISEFDVRMKSYEEFIQERRGLLKAHDYETLPLEDWADSDQRKGANAPPLEKPYPRNSKLVGLPKPNRLGFGHVSLFDALSRRQSRREKTDASLTLEELSFLLWATQGVRSVDPKGVRTLRVVPSGGARQPFETYLIVNRVNGLKPGVYRFLPIEHKLLPLRQDVTGLPQSVTEACFDQDFVGKSAVVFVWAAIPYRTEWRYSIISYKDILIEAGHICQNLYLACEEIGAGTCAIAAYSQKAVDDLIGVDGKDEITVYLAPVGKMPQD